MKNRALFSTLLTAVLAAVSYVLRWRAMADLDEYGIPPAGSYFPWLVTGFVIAAAAVLFLSCDKTSGFDGSYSTAMHTHRAPELIISLVAGALLIAAGVGELMAVRAEYYSLRIGEALMPALFAISGIVLIFETSASESKKSDVPAVCGVVPTLTFCIWVVVSYRDVAALPSVFVLMYRVLAPCAAAVAAYYSTGFLFGLGKPRRTQLMLRLTALLCAVTLADETRPYRLLVLLAVLLSSLARNYALTRALSQTQGEAVNNE